MNRNKNLVGGFTLVEVLAALAIIGILAGMIMALSSFAVRKAQEKRATAQLQHIRDALDTYKVNNGAYPAASQFVDTRFTTLLPPSLKLDDQHRIIDPWGNPYTYIAQGPETFDLYSKGHDGQSGSPDTDADNVR